MDSLRKAIIRFKWVYITLEPHNKVSQPLFDKFSLTWIEDFSLILYFRVTLEILLDSEAPDSDSLRENIDHYKAREKDSKARHENQSKARRLFSSERKLHIVLTTCSYKPFNAELSTYKKRK